MKIYKYDIVFQEVPNEISLAFYVCGCPLRCKGCHSTELWSERNGTSLSINFYQELLNRYQDKATCILFLGGEWHPDTLQLYLQIAKGQSFKTALYTGLDDITQNIRAQLDYLKLGPWIAELGGLSSPTTNQVFWDLRTGRKLNHLFLNQHE